MCVVALFCMCGLSVGLCVVCGVSVGAYVLCVVSVWGLMCVARHALECGVCEMYVNKTWLLYKYIQPFPPWYSNWTNSH